jgi:anti-sigma-K factor RskA
MSDVHQLAAAYALDALDDDERSAFEAHLPGCADCTAEVEGFIATAALLGSAAAQTPPPSLRDRILAEVATTRQDDVLRPATAEPAVTDGVVTDGVVTEPPAGDVVAPVVQLDAARRRRTRVMAALGVAAAVLLVTVVGVVLSNREGVSTDDVLAAPDVEVVALDGEQASVQVAWSPELGRVVVAGDDLAAPGPDLVYELWAIVDGTPRPAGLISHDGGPLSELIELDDLDADDVAAWGITIEPEGGSAAPTPPILYYAEV